MFFNKCCAEVDVPPCELLKWIRTRWASLFKMLEQVICLRKVRTILNAHWQDLFDSGCQGVNRFMQLADDSDEVPDLQKKTYSAFKLTAQEWSSMELIRDVLKVRFYSSTETVLTKLLTLCHDRNLLTLNRRSQPLGNLLYGEQFLSLNIFKRHGEIWPNHRRSTAFQCLLHLAWLIFISGTERRMIQMSILSALVRVGSVAFTWWYLLGLITILCSTGPQLQGRICQGQVGAKGL